MEIFAHLAVLVSIILGLGLSHLLSRVGELVQARATLGVRVTTYWVQLAWVLVVFLAHVQLWWSLFRWADRLPQASYFEFLLVLMGPVTLFMASRIALPDLEDNPTVDLRQYFFAIRPWFFTILGCYPLVAAVTMVFVDDWRWSPDRLVQLALSAALFSGALVRSERYHRVLAAAVLATTLLFIARFTLRVA
ncbi:MAG TPA: hypothetical protein VFX98_10615 [Longimicrobiaceae bacterium]|nr:hypothetical protein [Longimicrobiaceae bacterium]